IYCVPHGRSRSIRPAAFPPAVRLTNTPAAAFSTFPEPRPRATSAKQPGRIPMKSKLFAYSRLDSLLVLAALVQLVVLLHGVLSFGPVSRSHSLITGLVAVFLMCTNFECIAHSFIHNPFFRSRKLNRAFSVFNSLPLGGPQTLYRLHHLHHHKYNNDAPD